MKNFITASLVILILVACKKERTCSCTITRNGNITTHSQSAGIESGPITLTLNIGLPIPLPPIVLPSIVISSARDTTIVSPYNWVNASKTNYDKVSKHSVKKTCPASIEESDYDGSTTVVPGSYTVTSTQSGTKKSTCKIE